MKLENYELHLPSYSIGDKIYRNIGPICSGLNSMFSMCE